MLEKSVPMGGVWGWRGILSFISPPTVAWLPQYFYKYVPEGIGLMLQTLGVENVVDEEIEKNLAYIDRAAIQIAKSGANHVHLGGPFGLVGGRDQARQLLKRLEEVSQIPSTTSITSFIDAFNTLSVKKVILIFAGLGIWPERYKKFLEDNGFDVVNTKSLGIASILERRKLPMSAQYDLGREAYLETPEADAILMPSGAWGGPPVVEALEEDFKVAAVSEHSVFVWAGLRALKIRATVKGWGRLFETL
jgi:maleate cis-trans isomerase